MTILRLHHRTLSSCNGPGLRYVIWTQGCSLDCAGCFNKKTHPIAAHSLIRVSDLLYEVCLLRNIEGVTVSGGEPLEQADAIAKFFHGLPPPLTKILYTGYTLQEILQDAKRTQAVAASDITLAGRYQSHLKHPYLGKKLILTTSRINPEYFSIHLPVELIVSSQTVTFTGLLESTHFIKTSDMS